MHIVVYVKELDVSFDLLSVWAKRRTVGPW